MIEQFIRSFQFQSRISLFNSNLDSYFKWIEDNKNLTDWNVILAGKNDNQKIMHFSKCSVSKVTRAKIDAKIPGIINIKALSNPSDLIADIDLQGKNDEFIDRFNNEKGQSKLFKKLRYDSGLGNTPQLIIYIIDKDSKASEAAKAAGTRFDLNAPEDIVGLCLNIPGAPKGHNNITKVMALIAEDDGGDIQ